MAQQRLRTTNPPRGLPAKDALGKTIPVMQFTTHGAISLSLDNLAPRRGWIVQRRYISRWVPGAGSGMSERGGR